MSGLLRRTVTLSCVIVACTVTAGLARADGDPASDFLVDENVYLPYQAPSHAASARLAQQVASVYASGDRIKVAVVASKGDLGAIPSLFGKPSDYAAFLGQELDGVYVGPLLVVMPTGYGIYDGGRSVVAEQAVLAGLSTPASPRSDDLVDSATTAVADLLKVHALNSPDVLKPDVEVLATAYASGRLTIRFLVYDDSGRAEASVTLTRAGRILLQRGVGSKISSYTKIQTQTLQLKRGLDAAGARLCVSAVDQAGNRSGASCRTIRLARPRARRP